VATIADRSGVRKNTPVIRYFSAVPGCGVIERHKRAGGICYEICDGQLTETEGGKQRVIMDVAELPGAFGGKARHVVANALAATAACRAVGITVKDIKAALADFVPTRVNSGRGNVYAIPPADAEAGHPTPVMVDYGHNAAALLATGELVSANWPGDHVAAITLPGDRRDELVAESAEAIASYFRTVVIYEDEDRRDRAPGEMRGVVAAAMRKARPGISIKHAHGARDALRQAVALAGDAAVLFVYEKMSEAMAALAAVGATPWLSAEAAASPADDAVLAKGDDPLSTPAASDRTDLGTGHAMLTGHVSGGFEQHCAQNHCGNELASYFRQGTNGATVIAREGDCCRQVGAANR
jgi:cyanophycin synthetase